MSSQGRKPPQLCSKLIRTLEKLSENFQKELFFQRSLTRTSKKNSSSPTFPLNQTKSFPNLFQTEILLQSQFPRLQRLALAHQWL
jgi:hypothetical protein